MDRAVRLEWWNIGWTISIIVVMGLAMGSSQTMKTAWVEDTLGLIPPIVFLIAVRFEKRKPSRLFPFGFDRVHSLSFLIAAVALALVGATLLWDAGSSLYAREHATVASVRILGRDVWLGWIMLAAQIYSIIPPYLIARKELPLSRRLQDEVLHTDALMNKANWLTGAAGLFGIIGLGLGWWWADSTAAAIISLDIILDGWRALKIATAELVDGAPRGLGEADMDSEARQLLETLQSRYPDASIRVRETGRYLHAEVRGARTGEEEELSAFWPGDPERRWRLVQVAFVTADDESAAPNQA
jgi:divalent metal cation (Fe/Co/Zn/Cd) transporter